MAKRCEICGKGPQFGKQVSHSHRTSNKVRYPNLRHIKAKVNGTVKYIHVCTRCLRSGKVEKAV
ncbi:MAG: 50S ribosomal protein L28 [candidate division WOR-3 bacterium]|nr:50S ribosomal protein L28 [candidate division WOR-3 bacterium]